jgi:peptide/nickel transport system permease protein
MKNLIPTTLAGKVGVIGSFISVVCAVIGPWIAPYDPEKPTVDVLQEPSFTHPFGTDASGLDIFSVVIAAFRTDLSIALLGVGASFVLGLLLGSISGFSAAGGRIWRALARIVDAGLDVFQSIPVTVFALALTAIFGRGTGAVITAVIFVTTPIFARLIRSSLHSVVQGGLVASCRILGLGSIRTLTRHALPNSVDSAVANVSVSLGVSVLLTAALSFLGAGVRPPTPEWGYVISMGANYVATGQWWISLMPGLVLCLSVVSFALTGEAVRDWLAGVGPSSAANEEITLSTGQTERTS